MRAWHILSIIFIIYGQPPVASSRLCPIGSSLSYNGCCEPCPPGFREFRRECWECVPLTFQPQPGQTECLRCPPNTRSMAGATACTTCPKGTKLLRGNVCGVCPPGKYYDDYEFSGCTGCHPGFFKAEEGIMPCMPCPPDSYSLYGSANCTVCPENQALFEDGSCGNCPAGKHYSRYHQTCYDCPPGTFVDFENVMEECYSCGGNTFSEKGASRCIECPRGEHYISSTKSCGKCPPGSYYEYSTLECDQCGVNQFTRRPGERHCDACSPGSFSRPGSSTCFVCPPENVYLKDVDKCGQCPQGDIYDADSATCVFNDYPY